MVARKFQRRLSRRDRELRDRYRGLYEAAAALMFRFDPAHLNFGSNSDEYEGEVERLLPHLPACRSADDVENVLHGLFSVELVGPAPQFRALAVALWALYLRYADGPRLA